MAVNRKTDSEINSGEVNFAEKFNENEEMFEKMMERVIKMMDKKLNGAEEVDRSK